jgi:hypothetical protein
MLTSQNEHPQRIQAPIIPFMYALMATLIAVGQTRSTSLLLCTIFQRLALVQRLVERKESLPNALMGVLSAAAYLSATR